MIRVYDDAGNVTETHEHKGDFKEAIPRGCFVRFPGVLVGRLRGGSVPLCGVGSRLLCCTCLLFPSFLWEITHVLAVMRHDAVIRVYDDAGNVIETHEHAGDFREAS